MHFFIRCDPSLAFLEVLPEWAKEQGSSPRSAWGVGPNGFKQFYFCKECNGWIEGDPSRLSEHNPGPLAGRSGLTYTCNRCGTEIAFHGKHY